MRLAFLKFSGWRSLNQEATKLTAIFNYCNKKTRKVVIIEGRGHLAREKDKV